MRVRLLPASPVMDRTGRLGETGASGRVGVPCRRRYRTRARHSPRELLVSSSSRGLAELAGISGAGSLRSRKSEMSGRGSAAWLLLAALLLLGSQEVLARRGRSRSRSKSRVQIGLPITGKYRDPESDQYYNNQHGAKILLASHFDLEYVLGHKIAFLCVARGTPRPHITWYKDGNEIYTHLYLHVHEWQMGKDKVKSKLEIDPATQMDAGVYECTADNMYSIDRRSFKTDFSIAFD